MIFIICDIIELGLYVVFNGRYVIYDTVITVVNVYIRF